MLAQLDICRESNIFSQPGRHASHIGPHDKTKNRDAYTAKNQRHLQSYPQEQPSITPITVAGHDKGPQLYVAPKRNEVHLLAHFTALYSINSIFGQSQVHRAGYRASMSPSPNAKLPPRVIPPRLQKQYAAP